MKPTIPDMGTVIRLENEKAVIRMKHEGSCKGCGAAAMGLCKGGLMQEVTARNPKAARIGDAVKIGLVQRVQYAGYVLAFVVPAAALILGMAGGHVLGDYAGFPSLDIFAGFFSLIAAGFFSLRRLKRLDSSHAIEIVNVLSGPWTPAPAQSDEEAVSDHFISNEYAGAVQRALQGSKEPEDAHDSFGRIFPD